MGVVFVCSVLSSAAHLCEISCLSYGCGDLPSPVRREFVMFAWLALLFVGEIRGRHICAPWYFFWPVGARAEMTAEHCILGFRCVGLPMYTAALASTRSSHIRKLLHDFCVVPRVSAGLSTGAPRYASAYGRSGVSAFAWVSVSLCSICACTLCDVCVLCGCLLLFDVAGVDLIQRCTCGSSQ